MRTPVDETGTLAFDPVREGVLSWNTFARAGTIEFRLLRAAAPATRWLVHSSWSEHARRSHSPQADGVRVDVDVVRSPQPFDGIEVRAPGVSFGALAFAAPAVQRPSLPYAGTAHILDVPARSQYAVEGERGWCSAASLSMINAYHGIDHSVPDTARAVFDGAYNGTGNWSFNVAFSGSLGLRAAVVYLSNLDHAQRFTDAGLPIALSYHWKDGELPGAPVEHSEGHLVVLCGFTSNGDCAVNDPAAPNVRTIYPRAAIETLWQRAGGVAYAIAPEGRDFVRAVNS